MSESIIIESYRYDHWPSRQDLLKAVNSRVSDLRSQRYACEVVPKEEEEDGEIKQCQVIRAIKYPNPTQVRPNVDG